MQMMFKIPQIDNEATIEKVESILENYRIALFMEPLDAQPKITSSFSIVPPTFNNQHHSTTEDLAVKRIDQERERKKFLNWVQKCVNRLSDQQRAIVVKRYMEHEDVYDYETYNDLGLSERTYYRIKPKALIRLALIMRIEIYKEEFEEAI
ncbi:ArpU family phage packaging/lysis transcriptional regulator [Gracilibacillus saliphilus]|uniref:ArpU family phage packaging/lysis transcriptional regulator n=1 Tax=Gracilibacillus saliphilus TaxID=543890 RepID=UPI001EE15AF4|nr:ArpU family phage packaging/lysis transcriptional regulator [Gracilibacillus saliphilus]